MRLLQLGLLGAALALFSAVPARAQEPALVLVSPDPVGSSNEFGRALSAADVTGDGVPELLVADPLRGFPFQAGLAHVFGGDGTLVYTLSSPDNRRDGHFGYDVAFVGDLDGDGVSDLLVGAPGESSEPGSIYDTNRAGRAYAFSGATGNNLLAFVSPNPKASGSFGVSVAGPGDVTGDGIPDLLIGADYEDSPSLLRTGRAYLFSGADGALVYTLDSPGPDDGGNFGRVVGPAGDLTGDGVPDLLVSALYESAPSTFGGQGRVHLFDGATGAFARTFDDDSDTSNPAFGQAFDLVGDLDGDGVSDLVVGAPSETDGGGTYVNGIAIAFSGATGTQLSTYLSMPPFTDNQFGSAVAPTGDVDLDGVPDVLIGAPFETARGVSRAGRVSVRSGADGSDLLTFETPNPVLNGGFGNAAAWVDFDGDGAPDPIIGAAGEGRVYVYTAAALREALGTAPVAVALAPQNPPVVVPATGGSFAYTATLTNVTDTPQTFDAWIVATLPNGSAYGPVVGPRTVRLPAGASATRTLTARVPAAAPPGIYVVTLNVGTYPATVMATSGFSFTKRAAGVAFSSAPSAEAPIVTDGADAFFGDVAAPTASARSAGPAAVAAYPNPARGRLSVVFELAAPGEARLAVYDILGREVAVLVDGAAEAGRHEVMLDGASLPSGTYLVRLEAEGSVQTHRIALVR